MTLWSDHPTFLDLDLADDKNLTESSKSKQQNKKLPTRYFGHSNMYVISQLFSS